MKPNRPDDVWRFIDKHGQGECWIYTGSTFGGRYGRFFLGQKSVLAHRIVFELENGPIPSGSFVMHTCNTKLCCNPDHLILGDNSKNQRHASASGAHKPGRTGILGISFDRKRQYWTAQGYLNGKKKNLYTGPHKEKAIAARKQWEAKNLIIF